MIKSKDDLKYYLEQDRLALRKVYSKPKCFTDEIWKFQILLRKYEYLNNCCDRFIFIPQKLLIKYKFKKLSIKLNFSIPINVFGPGLSIAHYGTIVVNQNSKIGKNCRIHEGVNIGSDKGNSLSPKIGDNVFIGTGAKIIGDIEIADGIAIGANSVVNKSFYEDNITIAGIPAKKISQKGSFEYLSKLLFK